MFHGNKLRILHFFSGIFNIKNVFLVIDRFSYSYSSIFLSDVNKLSLAKLSYKVQFAVCELIVYSFSSDPEGE